MFKERRITAGIDKSYLLEPIVTTTTTTTTTKRVIAAKQPTRDQSKMPNYSKVIVPPLQNRSINQDINGNSHNGDPLDRTFRPGDTTLVNFNKTTKTTIAKSNATKTGIAARKLTPAPVNSSSPSPPLKNVTNQNVSHLSWLVTL